MRIERLRLTNFRGFAALDIEFPAHGPTVIVGNNGAGKTSILEALRILLIAPEHHAYRGGGTPAVKLSTSDISIGHTECTIEISILALPASEKDSLKRATWEARCVRAPKREDPTLRSGAAQSVSEQSARITLGSFMSMLWPSGMWPIRAFYPVERSALRNASSLQDTTSAVQENDGRDIWDTLNFSAFVDWFVEAENVENERIRYAQDYRDPGLNAVRTAIERLCEGFSRPRVHRAQRHSERTKLVVDKIVDGGGHRVTFELDQLSHGERGLIALVGDIARRLTVVNAENPSFDNNVHEPLEGPGIVMIDEAELHLHPSWQRELVPRLERTFPNVQFILTTHSPQVLGHVHPNNIKIIENFRLVERTPPTYGRDSNSILSEVMGVPERPDFASARLEELAILIDQENWSAAREQLQALTRDLGELDAEVIRLRTMISLLDDQAGTAA